jgi:hypothetical protein
MEHGNVSLKTDVVNIYHLNNGELTTMYKNNSRNSSEYEHCSPHKT